MLFNVRSAYLFSPGDALDTKGAKVAANITLVAGDGVCRGSAFNPQIREPVLFRILRGVHVLRPSLSRVSS